MWEVPSRAQLRGVVIEYIYMRAYFVILDSESDCTIRSGHSYGLSLIGA